MGFKEENSIAGIYCLINKRSGKEYIGSSRNIYDRIWQHGRMLEMKRHYNKDLQEDVSNGDKFKMVVLEKMEDATSEELHDRERFYIIQHDSINSGYNKVLPESMASKLHYEMVIKRDTYYRKYFGMTYGQFRNIGYRQVDLLKKYQRKRKREIQKERAQSFTKIEIPNAIYNQITGDKEEFILNAIKDRLEIVT